MTVRIYLTGSIRIEGDGLVFDQRALSFPHGPVALAFLVCERDRPVGLSEIADVVWDGSPPPGGRDRLSTILGKLQLALSHKAPFLELSLEVANTCELRAPNGTWVDVEAAAEAIHDAEGALRMGRVRDAFGPSAIAHHIAHRPFLAGERGLWLESNRERLRSILVRALECRAAIFLWNGEYPLAIEAAREVLSLEPIRETGHQLLIKAYAAAGNRAEALRAYDRCRVMLEDRLGVEPSEQSRAVYESLRRPAPRVTAHPDTTRVPQLSGNDVGRDPADGEGLSYQLQNALGDAYRVERELPGGMSRVFVAFDSTLGRRVVVKVLGQEMAEHFSADRFMREVQMTAALQQANIVPLLTTGIVAGLPYYTMPFISGDSLRTLLDKGKVLDIARIVAILRDVARGLAFAHAAGVVHRDIKPENVLLSANTAVITDFGIAKALNDADYAHGSRTTTTITRTGAVVGTPEYMAPEQVSGDPNLDHRADIYSFGVLAYELLTGFVPFADRPARKVLAAHLIEEPRDVRKHRHDIQPGLAHTVMQCLAKDPAARPSNMVEILAELG